MRLEYITKDTIDKNKFIKVPKDNPDDPVFSALRCEARMLYALMLDRTQLSRDNNWFTQDGKAYIYYSNQNIRKDIKCGKNKASDLLGELVEAGLIEKKRTRDGNVFLVRQVAWEKFESRETEGLISDHPEVCKEGENKTNNKNEIIKETESNHILSYEYYEERVKENIDYTSLVIVYPDEQAIIDGFLTLILEVIVSKNDTIRIAGKELPAELVRGVFLQLRYDHITYVLSTLKRNTSQIHNIRNYMLTVLYNAYITKAAFYQAWVNHDFPQFVD